MSSWGVWPGCATLTVYSTTRVNPTRRRAGPPPSKRGSCGVHKSTISRWYPSITGMPRKRQVMSSSRSYFKLRGMKRCSLQVMFGQFKKWINVAGESATNFYVDHAENCDKLEEDSVDRLWLVVRSLKNPKGSYVTNNLLKIHYRIIKSKSSTWSNWAEWSSEWRTWNVSSCLRQQMSFISRSSRKLSKSSPWKSMKNLFSTLKTAQMQTTLNNQSAGSATPTSPLRRILACYLVTARVASASYILGAWSFGSQPNSSEESPRTWWACSGRRLSVRFASMLIPTCSNWRTTRSTSWWTFNYLPQWLRTAVTI